MTSVRPTLANVSLTIAIVNAVFSYGTKTICAVFVRLTINSSPDLKLFKSSVSVTIKSDCDHDNSADDDLLNIVRPAHLLAAVS
jgi:hypothetical protein